MKRKLIRARIVLPITAPPVEDGAVLISGGRVVAIGRWRDLSATASDPVQDLGDAVLLPGFVNAHCHLAYTGFSGYLPPPKSFTDWIQGVMALKAQWSFSDYAAFWITGARELMSSGVTTVLDCESVRDLLPDVWSSTALRVVSAIELTGVRSGKTPETILGEALEFLDGMKPGRGRGRLALAPHAPYSTRPELLTGCARTARERGWPVTIHVAESREEFEMFLHASGRMHDWLQAQRDMSDCGGHTPVERVALAGLLSERAVLVHVNYVEDRDIALIAESGASVVHCPRSHAYFGHAPFPLERFHRAGVRVALGTDSLLSVRKTGRVAPHLDFFAELREAADAFPGVPASRLLEMATVEGGRAVEGSSELGCLASGATADMIVVPYSGSVAEVSDFVVRRTGPVMASMVSGAWIHPTGLAAAEVAEGDADGDGEGDTEPTTPV